MRPACLSLVRGRWLALLVCLALALTACSRNTIVGKWARGNEGTATFTADGKMIDQEGTNVESGTYSIEGEILSLKLASMTNAAKFTISFPDHDRLVLALKPEPGQPLGSGRNSLSFTRVSD